jgi:hypothetical protein
MKTGRAFGSSLKKIRRLRHPRQESQFARLSLLALTLVLIAGCGGSSGDGGSNGGGATPTVVSFTFSSGTPTAVAAKIGSGSFTVQTLTGGKLSLSIPSGTSNFAVAYACTSATSPPFQEVFEASVADGSSFTLPCLLSLSTGAIGTLTGNVDASAIPSANLLEVAVDNGSLEFNAGIPANTNFSLNAPSGNDRVEVLAYNNVPDGGTSVATLVAAKNFTNQTIPGALNGGSPVVLGAGDETSIQTIAYANVPTGYSAPSTQVDFNMGGHGRFPIATASTQYPLLPAGAISGSDFYEFFSTATNSSKPSEQMIVTKDMANPGALSFTFPSPWSYAGPSPAALPSFTFSYSGFSGNAGVYDTALLGWSTSGSLTQYLMIASSNYQGGATTMAFPDLSNVAGFPAPPPSGTGITWVAAVTQSSKGVSQPISSNATITTVANFGFYTVP